MSNKPEDKYAVPWGEIPYTVKKKSPSREWEVPRTTTHRDRNYRPLVLRRNVLYIRGHSNSVPFCQYYVMVFTTVLLVQVVRHTAKILQRYSIAVGDFMCLSCFVVLSYHTIDVNKHSSYFWYINSRIEIN